MAVLLALRRSEGEPRYDSEVTRFSYRDLEETIHRARVKEVADLILGEETKGKG